MVDKVVEVAASLIGGRWIVVVLVVASLVTPELPKLFNNNSGLSSHFKILLQTYVCNKKTCCLAGS